MIPNQIIYMTWSKISSSKDPENVFHVPFLETSWHYIESKLHQQKNQYQNGLFKGDRVRVEIVAFS